MNMKSHIIKGLWDVLERWENLLNDMDEAQITAPQPGTHWSIKDDIAHLMAWQLRTRARFEAALQGREPVFPDWPSAEAMDEEGDVDQLNNWLYEHYRDQSWAKVHQAWKVGFQRLLAMAEQVPERYLLDSSRYPWLSGGALAYVLLATYDHHQEHYEKCLSSLPAAD